MKLLRNVARSDPELWEKVQYDCEREDNPDAEVEGQEDDEEVLPEDDLVPDSLNDSTDLARADDANDEYLPPSISDLALDPRDYLSSLMTRQRSQGTLPLATSIKIGLADELEPGDLEIPASDSPRYGRGQRTLRPTTRYADHVQSGAAVLPDPEDDDGTPSRKRTKRSSQRKADTAVKAKAGQQQLTLDGKKMDVESGKKAGKSRAKTGAKGGKGSKNKK